MLPFCYWEGVAVFPFDACYRREIEWTRTEILYVDYNMLPPPPTGNLTCLVSQPGLFREGLLKEAIARI